MVKRKNVHTINGGAMFVVGIWQPSINDFEPLTPSQKEILQKNAERTHRQDLRVFTSKNQAKKMAYFIYGYTSTRIASVLDIRK